jgi:hypothetical protein
MTETNFIHQCSSNSKRLPDSPGDVPGFVAVQVIEALAASALFAWYRQTGAINPPTTDS